MLGNYPVNDDWIFVRQVEAFNNGILKLSAELDPSFLAQGFLGYLWSKLFGTSFISFQNLTILITLLGLWFLIKILKQLEVDKKLLIISSLIYIFNPIVFNSTFSFMTDNYFLTFMLGAIYFFLNKSEKKNILFGSVFILLASLTRQVGIFIGFSFIAAEFYACFVEKKKKNIKNVDKSILFVFIAVLLGIILPIIWPDYGSNRMFLLPEQALGRLKQWFLSIYYFPLFMFPLFFGIKTKQKKVIFSIFLVVLTLVLYNLDIFSVGNVLYIENLHTKSDFKTNFSLFDNIFFKLGLSALIAFSFTKLIYFLKRFMVKGEQKKCSLEKEDIFLLSLFVLNFGILLISSDFYDRYLLPSFVCLLILFLKKHKELIKVDWRVVGSVVLLVLVSIVLQWEFSTKTRVKYQQARLLTEKTGYYKQIDLDDTYRKYAVSVKENDYTGLIDTKVFDKECYVQEYTVDTDCKLLKFVQNIEDKVDKKIIGKKKPLGVNKKNIPRVKNNLDKLVYNQEYFSFLYTLVGKKAYVSSWCTNEN
ncbi:glycosyltransferase family 39 protein [Patescibacteria group bacterium]